MRVIAGKARRISLMTPKGFDVRPTTDRTKETLFNIINVDVYDSKFLDLFSGSGAIGIEALSRGASSVSFVEKSIDSLKCIKDNLEKTRLSDMAHIYKIDVIHALNKFYSNKEKFDIIFLDPPYDKGWESKVISLIEQNDLLDRNGMIICESSIGTTFDFIDDTKYEISKEKLFRTNKFTFIKFSHEVN
ncbi:16S rRNA (guanine(966)-N(2))-methyltransferase RsmD [Vallitalea sp.]|jgi:16S rRNA (guanine(966)-N(2))-methyltransferase RsmD|uniref:16S rRNA (guanine(966)-N(2))-methyltransferase RsmD n=1 Tax=Vallitalea sp. TaxID=1882829 RepID=UPI0025D87C45|nr:16S rRNA (guanine(966)-N(2))-methyltransferase RsmD [Vallitalea sp.]MCT4687380.1 16S rRNA (guanine(966)-N(2))-methyltransferase RsmD [Vallitalea sp.]